MSNPGYLLSGLFYKGEHRHTPRTLHIFPLIFKKPGSGTFGYARHSPTNVNFFIRVSDPRQNVIKRKGVFLVLPFDRSLITRDTARIPRIWVHVRSSFLAGGKKFRSRGKSSGKTEYPEWQPFTGNEQPSDRRGTFGN